MKEIIAILWIFIGINFAIAQEDTPEVQRKNTIKLDLTANFWYNNAIGVSYERITKPNQSFAISAGYQQFPRAARLGENIAVRDDRDKSGYKFGAEYRFYLKKENKYPVPRGLYIGPYFTRHSFTNDRVIEVDNNGTIEDATLNSKLAIFNIGFELGYQFLFNNRWTIDVVFMGPSVSHYRCRLELGGNYTFNENDIQNEIILDLIDRFPLLDEAISEEEAISSGNLNTWGLGYRYQVLVGYHFGRKREKSER